MSSSDDFKVVDGFRIPKSVIDIDGVLEQVQTYPFLYECIVEMLEYDDKILELESASEKKDLDSDKVSNIEKFSFHISTPCIIRDRVCVSAQCASLVGNLFRGDAIILCLTGITDAARVSQLYYRFFWSLSTSCNSTYFLS